VVRAILLEYANLFINKKGKKTQKASFYKGGKMSTIYFSRALERKDFTIKIMQIFNEHFKKAKNIFLKPNVVSYESYPTTTHSETLETILKELSNRQVTVGDAPAIDAGMSNKIIAKSALKQVCDSYGVRFVNLYSEKMLKVKSPRGYGITISSLPSTCDFIISLPVLKTHFMVGLSGALKNQFGYLSKKDRLLMHARIKNLNKGIAEVNAAVPTNLFIVDAVETMFKAQECRHGGCTAKLGYMLAGTDPVAIDYFGLQLLQEVEPMFEENKQKAMRYIDYAESIGVGSKKHTLIEI
jgi:uncharacterized protein (DUF362 family)